MTYQSRRTPRVYVNTEERRALRAACEALHGLPEADNIIDGLTSILAKTESFRHGHEQRERP